MSEKKSQMKKYSNDWIRNNTVTQLNYVKQYYFGCECTCLSHILQVTYLPNDDKQEFNFSPEVYIDISSCTLPFYVRIAKAIRYFLNKDNSLFSETMLQSQEMQKLCVIMSEFSGKESQIKSDIDKSYSCFTVEGNCSLNFHHKIVEHCDENLSELIAYVSINPYLGIFSKIKWLFKYVFQKQPRIYSFKIDKMFAHQIAKLAYRHHLAFLSTKNKGF